MSLKDIFQRNRAKQLDTEPEEGGDSELMAGNDAVRKKQLLYLGCGGAVALVLGSWYVMGDDAKLKPVGTDGKEVKITTDDMVNRNMSDREWQAASEAQMQSINNQLKGVDGQRAQMEQLQAQIAALQGEHGLFRLFQIEAQEKRLQAELAKLTAEREAIANKTHRLSSATLDLELLDEQARRVLGLGRPDEMLIR